LIDRWARRAELLHHQANRLSQLIEDMLDVFGLGRTGLRLEEEDCELAEIAQAVVSRFAAESTQAQEKLQLRAESVRGRWDRRRVDQIFTHLLSNALKFGGERPIEILVESTGDHARISVRDHGIGIALEDQERIFGRFERAAPSEHFGGLGLGLWIVHELVGAMGGTVRVESRPLEGTLFVVDLPRKS
jgi:signal transduction histidine kinase